MSHYISQEAKPQNRSRAGSVFFQPKLTVNQPGDMYEQEADAMADKVMRMPEAVAHDTFFKPSYTHLQRKCAHCEAEEKKEEPAEDVQRESPFEGGTAFQDHDKIHAQRKCSACEEEEHLQRSENGGNEITGDAAPLVSEVTQLAGNPMDTGTRHFFESRFGYDFGDVRIHNDAKANLSASRINAQAYTSSNKVVFGTGKYQPDTDTGKRLLAHELAHVVQQGNKTSVQRKPGDKSQEPVAVKILWKGTVFASLYYFIRPVCDSEEQAKQIVLKLLADNSFTYILKNGNNVPMNDFEYVENFEKTNTINIYDGALQIIMNATGNKTREEFFKLLEKNKAMDQKASQLVKELRAEGFDIHYENSWLDAFLKGVGQSALSATASAAYEKMKGNATSWENGPAFYTGINVGFPAGVAEDLWDNIKGIFMLAWQLIKAQYSLATDPLGFLNAIKQEIETLWQVISADPVQLGLVAGDALAKKISKDFVNVNSFNQGFALGEITGQIATEIALAVIGFEEIAAIGKAAEGTKLGGMIIKALRESEVIGKVSKLVKGEKGVVAAEEGSKALTEIEKLEEVTRAAQKAGDEAKPGRDLVKLEQQVLEEKIKDPSAIKLSKDGNLPEVQVGDHTYRRNAQDRWCRFSTENCDIALSPSTVEALDKAAAKKTVVVFDSEMQKALLDFWEQQKKLTTDSSKIKTYEQYIQKIKKGERPTWTQSEKEMEFFYSELGGDKQRAYKNARPSAANAPGHVRPDLVVGTTAVEIKNYKIENKSNLISKLEEQIRKRKSMEGLAYDIRQQGIIVDLRGQAVADSEVIDLTIEIQKRTQVPFENIQVLQWAKP